MYIVGLDIEFGILVILLSYLGWYYGLYSFNYCIYLINNEKEGGRMILLYYLVVRWLF